MKPCCENQENLERVEDPRPDVVVRVCRECGCRHIEVTVDPAKLGLLGASL